MQTHSKATYQAAIADLRHLLAQIGRAEFKRYSYASQLRQYRQNAQVAA
jgi:predicted component of type VI protein secretion system